MLGLSPEIAELAIAAPYGVKGCGYEKTIFLPYIPPYQRSLRLVQLYYEKAAWMYGTVSDPRPPYLITLSLFPLGTAQYPAKSLIVLSSICSTTTKEVLAWTCCILTESPLSSSLLLLVPTTNRKVPWENPTQRRTTCSRSLLSLFHPSSMKSPALHSRPYS